MEWVRSSIAALLLFLTLLVLVASGDDAAAAVEEQCHPLVDDELYQLVTLQHKDGEEIRLLADGRSRLVSGFANRSGHWFYATGQEGGNNNKRRLIPLPESPGGGSSRTAEGLWNMLGALANTTAASDPAPDYYMLVAMQTSGGDKKRLVVVVNQRYLSVTGFAQGFSSRPNWFFREGLVVTLDNDVWSSHGGGSHAEVVASNLLLGALMSGGASC